MIIGRPVQVLGDSAAASQSVKDLQTVLNAIAAYTGGDYGVGTPTGKVDHKTASALWKVVSDGVEGLSEANIPVLSQLVSTMDSIVSRIPIVGEAVSRVRGCLDDRYGGVTDPCSFEAIWKGIKLYDASWHQTNLVNPIRNAAAQAHSVLKPVADRLRPSGATPTTPLVKVATLIPGLVATGGYPPGTVAIRDPILGKYRLIAPAK